jgi:hypothetical protein
LHRWRIGVVAPIQPVSGVGDVPWQQFEPVPDRLGEADQVVVGSAGDLPGKKVPDLLKILDQLRDHAVGLYLHREGIDTTMAPPRSLTL